MSTCKQSDQGFIIESMSRISKNLVCLCLVLFVNVAFSHELPTAAPESVGLSSKRLERIANTVQRYIDDKRIVGAATLVMRRGKIAWAKAQGLQDREAGKPIQLDTIFRIASMAKPITTVALLMLYEEGYFLISDPISKYLPEFKNPKVLVQSKGRKPRTVPATKEITILDLLRHTSGISYHWNEYLGPLYTKANIANGMTPHNGTLEENIKNLAKQPLLFNPSERFEYGLNTDVLGRLIEVLSGKSLDEFLRVRLFEPLGMKDTYFYLPPGKVDRLAAVYNYSPEKGLLRQTSLVVDNGFPFSADYPYEGPKKYFSGGGGLVSTILDYARFAEMLLNNGRLGTTRILSRKTIEMMTRDQLGDLEGSLAGLTFGFGFNVAVNGTTSSKADLSTAGSYGWGGYLHTWFTIDPKEQMVILFMTQVRPNAGLPLRMLVRDGAYQAIDD